MILTPLPPKPRHCEEPVLWMRWKNQERRFRNFSRGLCVEGCGTPSGKFLRCFGCRKKAAEAETLKRKAKQSNRK
jgi:hypothetical protein